ncbi:PLP-dependent transferase [Phellopilus nigrolimitatus]|nr:PLP-dependent transferase [Phellopilus nigrolimitatus]
MKRLEVPPAFGHSMLKHFGFEPSYINLNNGSYGSLPLPVLEACEQISREIESNPDRYMRSTYIPLLQVVRGRVAELLGADIDECVIVPNATHGVNTVLRNLSWGETDIVVGTAVTYAAIARTIQYISDIPPHPQQTTFVLNFPTTTHEILEQFRAHLKSIPRQDGRKVIAIIDAIVSVPGVLLPWEKMVKICKEEDVVSVIDAAHAIGQQVSIDLKVADPDFWISNCHKWLYAKRGCAVLYVPKRNQHLIKTTLPTSAYYVSPSDPPGGPEAPNFVNQFQWTGTLDLTPFLSVSHALDFRQWIGGEEKINAYCHGLALKGGRRLAEILSTRVMDEDGEFTANMVNVELPLHVGESQEVNNRIRGSLLSDWNICGQSYHHNGKWWIRCSAQIYNEMSDFEKLGEALVSICKAIEEDN